MAFRVSTRPDGDRVWWREQGVIPGDHTNIRAATADETAMVVRILNHDAAGRMPPLSLGDKMRALLARWRG